MVKLRCYLITFSVSDTLLGLLSIVKWTKSLINPYDQVSLRFLSLYFISRTYYLFFCLTRVIPVKYFFFYLECSPTVKTRWNRLFDYFSFRMVESVNV